MQEKEGADEDEDDLLLTGSMTFGFEMHGGIPL